MGALEAPPPAPPAAFTSQQIPSSLLTKHPEHLSTDGVYSLYLANILGVFHHRPFLPPFVLKDICASSTTLAPACLAPSCRSSASPEALLNHLTSHSKDPSWHCLLVPTLLSTDIHPSLGLSLVGLSSHPPAHLRGGQGLTYLVWVPLPSCSSDSLFVFESTGPKAMPGQILNLIHNDLMLPIPVTDSW